MAEKKFGEDFNDLPEDMKNNDCIEKETFIFLLDREMAEGGKSDDGHS